MKVKIVKEVKRSDGLWRFACGDVFLQKDIVHPKPFDFEISCQCQKSFAIWKFSAPGLQRAVTGGFQHFLWQNSGMSSVQQPEKPQKPWKMINLGQEEYLKTIGS